jgi:hypothetical protein
MRIHSELWLPAFLYFGLLAAPHKQKIHGKYPPKLNIFDYLVAMLSGCLVLLNMIYWASFVLIVQMLNLFRRHSYHNPFE